MQVKLEEDRSWVWRKVFLPVLGLLRMGVTPERLAWSIAIGVAIGINPLIGSTTVLSLLLAFVLRLSVPASQVGTHSAYPIQLLLFLPFVHVGTVLFGTKPIPLSRAEIMPLARHPWELTKMLWMWEWHALVVWAVVAAVFTPALALLLGRVLRQAMPKTRPSQADLQSPL